MTTTLLSQINTVWAAHFHLSLEVSQQAGTTLIIKDKRTRESWLTLWQVGQRIVIEIAPDLLAEVQQIIDALPTNPCLSAKDFDAVWGIETLDHSEMKMYVLEAAKFTPFTPAPHYLVRQLTPDDQPAFDDFLARCSEDDKDEGDVSIDHEIAFGIFDQQRIVAAASIFEWRGFIDIGVLTDPDYRKQGLGKAAVGRVCAHFLSGPRLIHYRHDVVNLGSQGIAEGLGFTYYATIESIMLKS